MAMVDSTLMCNIMNWLKTEVREPRPEDFHIGREDFGLAIEFMTNMGVIENATVLRDGQSNRVQMVMLKRASVTLKGEEFLNSFFNNPYR